MNRKKYGFVGLQNGDEGKGKIVEYVIGELEAFLETGERILGYRFQGGPNAGHTVKIKDEVYKLHQLSSGIVNLLTFCLLGKGMLLNPRKLVEEIKGIMGQGIAVSSYNLGISSQAHMILDYHVSDDQAAFNLAEHESTGNGIKQSARDKYHRVGIRFIEFLDRDLMIEILREKATFLQDIEKFVDSYEKERKFLAQFLVQENEVFNDSSFKFWMAEGAQGVMLDIDDGQYPGITSSSPSLPTRRPDVLIGVVKAYVSSVGIKERPFVSEMSSTLQESLVETWQEFGTTTGKPRHIGWFDAVAAKYAVDSVHADYIALTCLDRLEDLARLGEKAKIVVGYEVDGKIYRKWDVSFDRRDTLKKAKPIFEELDSWTKTTSAHGYRLTQRAQKYKDRLEQLLGKKIVMIGTGPGHEEIIIHDPMVLKP